MDAEELTLPQTENQNDSIIIIEPVETNPNVQIEITDLNPQPTMNNITEPTEIVQNVEHNEINETETIFNQTDTYIQPHTAKFVSKEGLDNLKYYKYSGEDKSLLVKYILAPYFWNPLVQKLPKWLAPNLITLFGGLCMFLA